MKGYFPLSQKSNNGPQYKFNENLKRAWLRIIFTALIICNLVVLLVAIYRPSSSEGQDGRTPYAQLERNKAIPIGEHSAYDGSNINLSELRQLWEDISIDNGMVALPDSFVASHSLPMAQRYPWDHSKGLYFLNGYHNLHCLRAVYISLMEFAHGEPQSRRFHHVLHCMEALRQDILCNADDTPRYTTADAVPESGVGQLRQCRDWGKLERWAREHNACYRFINQTANSFPNVLRYTFCPPGSADTAEVERVMGGIELNTFPSSLA